MRLVVNRLQRFSFVRRDALLVVAQDAILCNDSNLLARLQPAVLIPLFILALYLVPLSIQARSKQANEAGQKLHALFAAEWDYLMEQNPTQASMLGDRRWNDRWPDVSLDAIGKRYEQTLMPLLSEPFLDARPLVSIPMA